MSEVGEEFFTLAHDVSFSLLSANSSAKWYKATVWTSTSEGAHKKKAWGFDAIFKPLGENKTVVEPKKSSGDDARVNQRR